MKKISIIGAGVSGLFLANLLEREKSISYKIYEKRESLDFNDGYGIQLSVNSINLLIAATVSPPPATEKILSFKVFCEIASTISLVPF